MGNNKTVCNVPIPDGGEPDAADLPSVVERDYITDTPRKATLDAPGTVVFAPEGIDYIAHHSVEFDGHRHTTACGEVLSEWERVETPLFAAFVKYDPHSQCYQCSQSVVRLANQAVNQ